MNKAVTRALKILDFISEKGFPVTLKQISDGLSIPASSAYDIVNTMLDMNYLQYADRDTKTYFIGLKAFYSGFAYVRDINFVNVAKPYLIEMSKRMKATTFLGVRSDDQVVYLDKVESDEGIKTSAVLGSGRGMYYTGLGKAILATMPEKEVVQLYAGKELLPKTEHTICSLEALKKELCEIRKAGYAFDDEEGEIGLNCVAAPIRDYEGKVVAAISVATLRDIVQRNGREKYISIVVDNAMKISRTLGYTGKRLMVGE